MRDKRRFAEVIGTLAANFRTEVSCLQLDMLWAALGEELTIERLERAAILAMRRLRFFPSAAELRALARPTVRINAGRIERWEGEGTGWAEWQGSLRALGGLTARERRELAIQLDDQRQMLVEMKEHEHGETSDEGRDEGQDGEGRPGRGRPASASAQARGRDRPGELRPGT